MKQRQVTQRHDRPQTEVDADSRYIYARSSSVVNLINGAAAGMRFVGPEKSKREPIKTPNTPTALELDLRCMTQVRVKTTWVLPDLHVAKTTHSFQIKRVQRHGHRNDSLKSRSRLSPGACWELFRGTQCFPLRPPPRRSPSPRQPEC